MEIELDLRHNWVMDTGDRDDMELVNAVRRGDTEAYGLLFARHRMVARRVAQRHGRAAEADDVVADVFARVLDRLRSNGGPHDSFRAYVLTAVRHEAARRAAQAARCEPVADLDPGVVPDAGSVEADRVRDAYATLSPRWRRTLWQLDVEGRRPHELAVELGMTPNAVSALGYRARSALRTAYLQLPRAA